MWEWCPNAGSPVVDDTVNMQHVCSSCVLVAECCRLLHDLYCHGVWVMTWTVQACNVTPGMTRHAALPPLTMQEPMVSMCAPHTQENHAVPPAQQKHTPTTLWPNKTPPVLPAPPHCWAVPVLRSGFGTAFSTAGGPCWRPAPAARRGTLCHPSG